MVQTLPAGEQQGDWYRFLATCGFPLVRCLLCLFWGNAIGLCYSSKRKRHCQQLVSWAPDYRNSPGSNPVNLILPRQRGTRLIIIRPGNFLLGNHMTHLPWRVTQAFSLWRLISGRDLKSVWCLLLRLKGWLPSHTFDSMTHWHKSFLDLP